MKDLFSSKKQTEVSTQPTLAPVAKPEPKFTETAYGLYKVPQVGETGTKYVLVEIPYDPETGATGKVAEVLRDNKEDATDKFKIKAGELFTRE